MADRGSFERVVGPRGFDYRAGFWVRFSVFLFLGEGSRNHDVGGRWLADRHLGEFCQELRWFDGLLVGAFEPAGTTQNQIPGARHTNVGEATFFVDRVVNESGLVFREAFFFHPSGGGDLVEVGEVLLVIHPL